MRLFFPCLGSSPSMLGGDQAGPRRAADPARLARFFDRPAGAALSRPVTVAVRAGLLARAGRAPPHPRGAQGAMSLMGYSANDPGPASAPGLQRTKYDEDAARVVPFVDPSDKFVLPRPQTSKPQPLPMCVCLAADPPA